MSDIQLPKTIRSPRRRVGRGYGSGRGGHTAGRGMKGQKSRAGGDRHILFEGIKTKKSLLRRLPFLRGKGKFSASAKPVVVKLGKLESLKEDKITMKVLIESGLVEKDEAYRRGVKILSQGKLTRKLVVDVPATRRAIMKINSLGGKVSI